MLLVPLLIAVVYGIMYAMMRREEFGFQSALDPFYFSFTTMSSVGYGDFSPKSTRAKALVMSQQAVMVMGILSLTDFFRRVL